MFAAQRPPVRAALLSNVLLASAVGALVGGGAGDLSALVVLPDVRPSGILALELAAMAAGGVVGALGLAGAAFLEGCSRFRPYLARARGRTRGCTRCSSPRSGSAPA